MILGFLSLWRIYGQCVSYLQVPQFALCLFELCAQVKQFFVFLFDLFLQSNVLTSRLRIRIHET